MKNLILITLLVLLLAPLQPPAAQGSSSATQAANRFYRTYLKLKILGLPNSEQMKALTPLITSDLNELFEAARKTQAQFIKDHPDEKPPWADGDLFTSLFEGAQSFRLGRPIANGDRVEVPVHLTYHQGGSTTRWSDVIVLVRDKNLWLVSDILLKGEWAFKSGDSLRKNLSSN
jgi:hypothetical protein